LALRKKYISSTTALLSHTPSIARKRSCGTVRKVFANGGYTGTLIDWVKQISATPSEIVKSSDRQRFQVLLKRWIVERTYAWLNRSRRLSKGCEVRQQSAKP
jgi:transposase